MSFAGVLHNLNVFFKASSHPGLIDLTDAMKPASVLGCTRGRDSGLGVAGDGEDTVDAEWTRETTGMAAPVADAEVSDSLA